MKKYHVSGQLERPMETGKKEGEKVRESEESESRILTKYSQGIGMGSSWIF